MKCPKCRVELYCPCKTCMAREKQKNVWEWIGEYVKCPLCGYMAHADIWEDAAYKDAYKDALKEIGKGNKNDIKTSLRNS